MESRGGLRYLSTLSNFESTGRLKSPTLARMESLASRLGSPEQCIDAIHITGTNGKGSTAAFAADMLARSGKKVGLYTSPHLREVNERIRIDGSSVGDLALDCALQRVEQAARTGGEHPTWFEAVTLAALLCFAESDVHAAVIEVGMLGTWDATNIIRSRVAVVTNVERDHVDEAGGSLLDVAREKAGIVEAGSTLILGDMRPELRDAFLDREPSLVHLHGRDLRATNARTTATGSVVDLRTPQSVRINLRVGMWGRHQISNALSALAAVEAFLGRPLDDTAVRGSLAELSVPGRCEIVSTRPVFVLDGAHNPAAGRSLRSAITESSTHGPRVLVVGALRGRDHREFLEAVGAGEYDAVICTEPNNSRALPAHELAAGLSTTNAAVRIEPDAKCAAKIAALTAGPNGHVVVTGSLYLLDTIRQAIVSGPTRPHPTQEEVPLA